MSPPVGLGKSPEDAMEGEEEEHKRQREERRRKTFH